VHLIYIVGYIHPDYITFLFCFHPLSFLKCESLLSICFSSSPLQSYFLPHWPQLGFCQNLSSPSPFPCYLLSLFLSHSRFLGSKDLCVFYNCVVWQKGKKITSLFVWPLDFHSDIVSTQFCFSPFSLRCMKSYDNVHIKSFRDCIYFVFSMKNLCFLWMDFDKDATYLIYVSQIWILQCNFLYHLISFCLSHSNDDVISIFFGIKWAMKIV